MAQRPQYPQPIPREPEVDRAAHAVSTLWDHVAGGLSAIGSAVIRLLRSLLG